MPPSQSRAYRVRASGSEWLWEVVSPEDGVIARGKAPTDVAARAAAICVLLDMEDAAADSAADPAPDPTTRAH